MTDTTDTSAGAEPEPEQPQSTEVVVLPREPLDLRHLSLYDVEKLASSAAKSRYFNDAPIASAAAVKIVWGQELGIPPMAALSGIHMVKGKPGLHYATIGALLKRHGYKVVPRVHTEEECVLEWYEPNPDFDPAQKASEDNPRRLFAGESSWTMAEAKTAGVVKDQSPWKTYPKVMLFARALSIGARLWAPEIFGGAIYTEDELRESYDIESTAHEVITSVPDIPVETPTVIAEPAQPTEQLISPSQKGALWLKAKNRGLSRDEFERLIKDRFDVVGLDRLPARLMYNAFAAVERYQRAESAGAPAVDAPPEPAVAADPPAATADPPPSPTPDMELCSVTTCMYDAAEKGLCFEHLDELRSIGSIGFHLQHPEWAESDG